MKNTYFISASVISLTMISGCASITQGTAQNLAFSIDTPGASCLVAREGDGLLGTITPDALTITVSKDKDDIVVTCNAPGHQEKVVRLVSEADPISLVGGFILDGGIVDAITGAAWIYPLETTIALEEAQPSLEDVIIVAQDEPPVIETPIASADVLVEPIPAPFNEIAGGLALVQSADPSPSEMSVEPVADLAPSFLAELEDTRLPAEALITLASEIPAPQAPDFLTELPTELPTALTELTSRESEVKNELSYSEGAASCAKIPC
jgi:hypothetical protein